MRLVEVGSIMLPALPDGFLHGIAGELAHAQPDAVFIFVVRLDPDLVVGDRVNVHRRAEDGAIGHRDGSEHAAVVVGINAGDLHARNGRSVLIGVRRKFGRGQAVVVAVEGNLCAGHGLFGEVDKQRNVLRGARAQFDRGFAEVHSRHGDKDFLAQALDRAVFLGFAAAALPCVDGQGRPARSDRFKAFAFVGFDQLQNVLVSDLPVDGRPVVAVVGLDRPRLVGAAGLHHGGDGVKALKGPVVLKHLDHAGDLHELLLLAGFLVKRETDGGAELRRAEADSLERERTVVVFDETDNLAGFVVLGRLHVFNKDPVKAPPFKVGPELIDFFADGGVHERLTELRRAERFKIEVVAEFVTFRREAIAEVDVGEPVAVHVELELMLVLADDVKRIAVVIPLVPVNRHALKDVLIGDNDVGADGQAVHVVLVEVAVRGMDGHIRFRIADDDLRGRGRAVLIAPEPRGNGGLALGERVQIAVVKDFHDVRVAGFVNRLVVKRQQPVGVLARKLRARIDLMLARERQDVRILREEDFRFLGDLRIGVADEHVGSAGGEQCAVLTAQVQANHAGAFLHAGDFAEAVDGGDGFLAALGVDDHKLGDDHDIGVGLVDGVLHHRGFAHADVIEVRRVVDVHNRGQDLDGQVVGAHLAVHHAGDGDDGEAALAVPQFALHALDEAAVDEHETRVGGVPFKPALELAVGIRGQPHLLARIQGDGAQIGEIAIAVPDADGELLFRTVDVHGAVQLNGFAVYVGSVADGGRAQARGGHEAEVIDRGDRLVGAEELGLIVVRFAAGDGRHDVHAAAEAQMQLGHVEARLIAAHDDGHVSGSRRAVAFGGIGDGGFARADRHDHAGRADGGHLRIAGGEVLVGDRGVAAAAAFDRMAFADGQLNVVFHPCIQLGLAVEQDIRPGGGIGVVAVLKEHLRLDQRTVLVSVLVRHDLHIEVALAVGDDFCDARIVHRPDNLGHRHIGIDLKLNRLIRARTQGDAFRREPDGRRGDQDIAGDGLQMISVCSSEVLLPSAYISIQLTARTLRRPVSRAVIWCMQ